MAAGVLFVISPHIGHSPVISNVCYSSSTLTNNFPNFAEGWILAVKLLSFQQTAAHLKNFIQRCNLNMSESPASDILECIYVTCNICHNMLSHVGICRECCKDVSLSLPDPL